MKTNNSGPPKLFHRFFRWYCQPDMLRYIEGDLLEMYKEAKEKSGKAKADVKFIIDVVLLFRPGIVRQVNGGQRLNTLGMYKSYFIIAWRTFLKNKGYSGINISGLAVGLAACILIMLYVHHELSYDRFHKKADRIYRVNNEIKFGDNHLDLALVSAAFGAAAKAEFPQVEQTARLMWYGDFLVKKGGVSIREGNVAFADSTLFEVFTLPMISGNSKTALTEPNSIVITESVAKKYFDRTDVLGQTLTINNTENRKVTGVIKDIPQNSHFRFTSFIPMMENEAANQGTWAGGQSMSTYLLLKPDVDAAALVLELQKMFDKNLGPELKSLINKSLDEFKSNGDFFKLSLTRLTDIHLHSNKTGELYGSGKIEYVYIFSAVALFILLIACINFMNLATARSTGRSREVGVRKVMGSSRGGLINQFITESFLTCVLAMVLAVALTLICLPYFSSLTSQAIDASLLSSPPIIATLIALVFVVGLLSGSYPAFYLSAFKPATVLKGGKGMSIKKSIFRNTLVVFQFTASIILIIETMIVFKQLEYIRKKDLGYNREQILIINNTGQMGHRMEPFKNNLLQLKGVEKATVSGYLPVNYYRSNDSFFSKPTLETDDAISMQNWTIDEDYITAMGMVLVEGRNFSSSLPADSTAIILNESAAKFFGNKNILDKRLYRLLDMETKLLAEYHVIGIVKDFNFATLREPVKPLAFMYGADLGRLNLKINTADIPSLLSEIERQWKALGLELPFEYSFMDEDFNRLYMGERQIGMLFTVFASLSILISCLGLFGLANFIAEQRTKEIGIRKVLGASVSGIAGLLSKDFLRLVLISIVLASPVAYYFMSQWLQGFAYRIDMQWWVFILSGFIAVTIALATVSFQAIKAARANPVNSLRSE